MLLLSNIILLVGIRTRLLRKSTMTSKKTTKLMGQILSARIRAKVLDDNTNLCMNQNSEVTICGEKHRVVMHEIHLSIT